MVGSKTSAPGFSDRVSVIQSRLGPPARIRVKPSAEAFQDRSGGRYDFNLGISLRVDERAVNKHGRIGRPSAQRIEIPRDSGLRLNRRAGQFHEISRRKFIDGYRGHYAVGASALKLHCGVPPVRRYSDQSGRDRRIVEHSEILS